MTKLNQIIAVEKQVKATAFNVLTEAHQRFQKPALLSGISRAYRSIQEDGEIFPPEKTRVQLIAANTLAEVNIALARLFDLTATKDATNGTAKADIVIDGKTLVKDVPATTLIFLEKQLIDLKTFVAKLPILDQAEVWSFDANTNSYATESVSTAKTKPIPRVLTRAEATDKHPAQTEVYQDTVIQGYWDTRKFSGAFPQALVVQYNTKIDQLIHAVKFAREQANSVEVVDLKIGKTILDYLFT